MICRFKFLVIEVPVIKKPVHWLAEEIISKMYTEQSGLLKRQILKKLSTCYHLGLIQ